MHCLVVKFKVSHALPLSVSWIISTNQTKLNTILNFVNIFQSKSQNFLRLSANKYPKKDMYVKCSRSKIYQNAREIHGGEAGPQFTWGVRVCLSFTVPHRPLLILLVFYDLPSASDSFHSKQILQPPRFCALTPHIQSSLGHSQLPKASFQGREAPASISMYQQSRGSWMWSCPRPFIVNTRSNCVQDRMLWLGNQYTP